MHAVAIYRPTEKTTNVSAFVNNEIQFSSVEEGVKYQKVW